MLIITLLILTYSAILHEIAHGWVADQLGDPTARISDRLTLDPRPHIDPLMTIAVPLILLLTGSLIVFGGAKPVPIDPFNFQKPKRDITLVSAAGPLTNFLIAILFALIIKTIELFGVHNSLFSHLAEYIVTANISLGLFNLLPVPPLDGFKVVGGLLPDNYAESWYRLEKFGLILLLFVLFFFSGFINNILYPVTNTLVHLLLSKPII